MSKEITEALKTLNVLDETISPLLEPILTKYEDDLSDKITSNYFALKEALLKAQKEHKALDIIKEKNVDLRTLKACFKVECGLQEYNKHQYKENELTEEEFKLLKEVLG